MNKLLPQARIQNDLEIVSHSIPMLIYRYVKPSQIEDESVTDAAFQLRENRDPPEEYISFYHSNEFELVDRLNSIEQLMKSYGFSFKRNSGLLQLNTIEAQEQINATRELIEFRRKNSEKIGLHYLTKDPVYINEAKTILAFISQLHRTSSFNEMINPTA